MIFEMDSIIPSGRAW